MKHAQPWHRTTAHDLRILIAAIDEFLRTCDGQDIDWVYDILEVEPPAEVRNFPADLRRFRDALAQELKAQLNDNPDL
jgi:hypothetical protein